MAAPRTDPLPVAESADPSPASADARRTAQWKGLFDQLYKRRSADPALNLAGWHSSYDRQPLSVAEMSEWLELTVSRIAELSPRRCLELGCGTGMLLHRLAPQCEAYWGLDLSAESIKLLEAQAFDPARVNLLNRGADELDDLPRDFFDTVIINSVAQYFPSVDYLVATLAKAAALIAGDGRIFVGDVRNLHLLGPLQAEIALVRAADDEPVAALQEKVHRKLAQERELLLAPEFFVELKSAIPNLVAVEARLKVGEHVNELTRFRYDVVLFLGTARVQSPPATPAVSMEALASRLREEMPAVLRVGPLTNSTTARAVTAWRLLDGDGAVGALRATADAASASIAHAPVQWIRWAQPLGYRADLCWSPGTRDGSFDVLLSAIDQPRPRWSLMREAGTPLQQLATQPLQSR